MIRRLEQRPGSADAWLLIPQIEHAHLAAKLAEAWGVPPFEPLPAREELLVAIRHHDDGWADWDRRPGVDPEHGRPIEFTEMPLPDALGIWRQSIDVAAACGNLAAYVVSGHFSALLRSARSRWETKTLLVNLAERFLSDQDERRTAWLRGWLSASPGRNEAMAQLALRSLQFFDLLSLWLCGAPRTADETLQTPEGEAVTLVPLGDNRFVARPWPLITGRWEAAVSARRVPVASYSTREALAGVEPDVATVTFVLMPD